MYKTYFQMPTCLPLLLLLLLLLLQAQCWMHQQLLCIS
jgi:hypothetical protein